MDDNKKMSIVSRQFIMKIAQIKYAEMYGELNTEII